MPAAFEPGSLKFCSKYNPLGLGNCGRDQEANAKLVSGSDVHSVTGQSELPLAISSRLAREVFRQISTTGRTEKVIITCVGWGLMPDVD